MSDAATKEEAVAPTTAADDAVAAPVDAAPSTAEGTTEVVESTETTEGQAEDTKAEGDSTKEKSDTTASKLNMLETTRVPDQDRRKNAKFDPKSKKDMEDPEKAIRKQVEFYFGDANLPSDEYMWNLTGGSENNPVPVETICKFKRMQIFEHATVVAALKESRFLAIEGEEGQETIKRKSAYSSDDKAWNRRVASTVYVKGFGDEEPTTQFDLEAFFATHGPVNSVRLRRDNGSNLFKGSVYVEFPSEEAAKAFVALDPPPKWKDHDLKIMTKLDYMAEKNTMIKEGKIQPSDDRTKAFYEGKNRKSNKAGGRGGRGRGYGRDKNGNIDRDDWNRRRDHDRRNGFKDNRGRGRGFGRGGNGRGGRDFKESRNGGNDEARPSGNDVKPPVIQATDGNGTVAKEQTSNGKRSRDDDADDSPPAKKVDAKAETVDEATA